MMISTTVEARKLQKRLENLGAQPFFRLGLGDDQHDFGSELRKLKVDPIRPLHSHVCNATSDDMKLSH